MLRRRRLVSSSSSSPPPPAAAAAAAHAAMAAAARVTRGHAAARRGLGESSAARAAAARERGVGATGRRHGQRHGAAARAAARGGGHRAAARGLTGRRHEAAARGGGTWRRHGWGSGSRGGARVGSGGGFCAAARRESHTCETRERARVRACNARGGEQGERGVGHHLSSRTRRALANFRLHLPAWGWRGDYVDKHRHAKAKGVGSTRVRLAGTSRGVSTDARWCGGLGIAARAACLGLGGVVGWGYVCSPAPGASKTSPF